MSKKPNANERYYHDLVREVGCLICRDLGHGYVEPSIHHLRTGVGISQKSSHYLVLPLCPEHHQHGGVGDAFHASPRQWESMYGTELQLLAKLIGIMNE